MTQHKNSTGFTPVKKKKKKKEKKPTSTDGCVCVPLIGDQEGCWSVLYLGLGVRVGLVLRVSI